MLGKSSGYIKCDENNKSYCYQYLKQDHLKYVLWTTATGSTIKNLSLNSTKKLEILPPDKHLICQFYLMINTLDEKRLNVSKQNQELASLRDWLLPMLMNGQVKVGNSEYVVEDYLGMAAEGEVKYGE